MTPPGLYLLTKSAGVRTPEPYFASLLAACAWQARSSPVWKESSSAVLGRRRPLPRHCAPGSVCAEPVLGGHCGGQMVGAGCGDWERTTGIEPAFSAWEADVLPLNYIRLTRRFALQTPTVDFLRTSARASEATEATCVRLAHSGSSHGDRVQ